MKGFFVRICFGFLFFLQFSFIALATSLVESTSHELGKLTIDLAHPVKRADLTMAFGGGVDGHSAGEEKKLLSPQNIQAMENSGLKPLSYRLRTELGVEAWHWNPHGSWSDTQQRQGYWTSSTTSLTPILTSYGYRLPRRGDTLDEANNDGYSRLDDGDSKSFWKSNPYLTSYYTGEADSKHPQWVVLDFEKPEKINAIRLHWKEPYARQFCVQYASGGSVYLGHNGAWHNFPHGKIKDGHGGEAFLFLGQPTFLGRPKSVRFVRILMTESSKTAPEPAHDPRDKMGYALGEIEVGEINARDIFKDHVVHRPDTQQTLIYVSSTDPWHRACDRDPNTEQPGLDLIRTCGLTHQLSTLWAIPILYDTPENAAAAATYIGKYSSREKSQAAPLFELGEEPDGQRVDPKDIATLYAQVSKKIHASLPAACLGGLSFVTVDVEPNDTTYRYDHRPWLRCFFQQLRKDHEEKNFRFLTFEWYPFDDLLLPPAPLLLKQPENLHKAVARLRHGGIPASMPLMISEYGYSVFSGEPEVTMAAALLNAEIAAQFLLLGGATSYLYGYEPNHLECAFGNSWGNLMMFLQNKKGDISAALPTYYAAQLVTQRWASPQNGPCELYPTKTTFCSKEKDSLVSAYFLHQKKSGSALLIINKNPDHGYELTCRFVHRGKRATASWKGPLEVYSYSSAQYQWVPAGPNGHPLYSKTPKRSILKTAETPICVPAWSITVVREKLSPEFPPGLAR